MNQPSDKINIIYDNNQTIQTIKGTTLNDILALIPQRNYAPVGAIVNNELQELDYPLYTDSTVTWVDISTSTGWLIYRRSLTFLLLLAVHECFPDHQDVYKRQVLLLQTMSSLPHLSPWNREWKCA